ncbi:MAG: aminotransferase class V-fold PLP-dependent enzyme, partial [Candidatus Hydrogenedentales bacterium]
MNRLETILNDPAERRHEFPVTGESIYMAHAGVAPITGRAAAAMRKYAAEGSVSNQESHWALEQASHARANAARLLGAEADEIALLGPTSLGLSLIAHGVAWEAGDEVVYYADDYPANVYPWRDLERRGVRPVAVRAEHPGVITPADVEHALSSRTRLVALASCNFLSGYRIDIDGIGRMLRERGVLFSLDAIQTLGAFPTPTRYVDFLAADSHKWLLGPAGAGVVYVAKERQEGFHPPLLGAANV